MQKITKRNVSQPSDTDQESQIPSNEVQRKPTSPLKLKIKEITTKIFKFICIILSVIILYYIFPYILILFHNIPTLIYYCKRSYDISIAIYGRFTGRAFPAIFFGYTTVFSNMNFSKGQIIAKGLKWAEGPAFRLGHSKQDDILLFSDVVDNKIYRYQNGTLSILVQQVYGGNTPRAEPGSNGIAYSSKTDTFYVCEHGNRRISRLSPTKSIIFNTSNSISLISIIASYNTLHLNSPNDLVFSPANLDQLYFTDPSYGLPMQNVSDPLAELKYEGVYMFDFSTSNIHYLTHMRRPNGIAFSPSGRSMYVSSSDKKEPKWMKYRIKPNGLLDGEGTLLYDAKQLQRWYLKGLPDGLVVNNQGIIFASGPGGVYIMNNNGTLHGFISFQEPITNLEFGRLTQEGIRSLYITSSHSVYEITYNEGI